MGFNLRERVALNLPPILLRLMLATVFIWAGLGKVTSYIEVEGPQAAALANMGVIAGAEPAEGQEAGLEEPVRVLRVHGLSTRLYWAANPAATDEVTDPVRLWPQRLGEGRLPVYFAWTVALVELIGGFGLLLGLLTRVWAFALAGVMAGAIWLTEIGVAVQSGQTTLGFLPAYDAFNPEQWQRLLWQFALLMSALALVFLGPGRASLDHALFGPSRDDFDDDE